MTQQEKQYCKGMYAAGFRYVVRDKNGYCLAQINFIKVDREWDVVNPETNRVTDLDTAVDRLFDWIKPNGEQIEIAKVIAL